MAALDCVRPALRRRDAAPNAVPETPTRLAAVGGNGGLALSWALPTNTTNIDKLQLRWKASAALPFTASDAWTDLAGDATGHRVMGLTNDTAYSVELRAVNELGAGTAATVAGTPQNLVPSFGAATVADQTLSRDKAMPVLALPEASGGDGPLTYAIAPALPTGLSLDMATRTVSGAPYAQQAATTYSWTASDEDGDSASLSFSIAVEYDFQLSFGVATVANRTFTQGAAITAFTLPKATGGNGALSYALTPDLPAGLMLDMATRTVSGTPTAALAATIYSWTATDADGDTASLEFSIEVLAGAGGSAERQAFAKSLAGLAVKTLGEARATIGQRLTAAPGASSLTVAGRRVEFGAASAPAAFDDDRRVSSEELRRDSAFEMAFGEAGMEMTAWGRGGLMRFEAEQAGIDHRSRMETGWLGMDARMGDGLLMGFALSRSAGETEASDGAGFTTALSAAWPYAQLKLASGAEVCTMLGAGNGSVDYRPAEGSGEREALEMRLASAGGRQPLADVGALGLALEADAGFVTLETGGSARSVIGGHEVQVWRARTSLEAEHEGWGLGGGALSPFGSLAWRGDGGDWREGSGVEAGLGADEDRMALELEARYGFRLPAAHGLLSPLLRLSEEEGVRRKLEAGLALEAARGRVDLELTGGHEARSGADNDHRLRLDLRVGF